MELNKRRFLGGLLAMPAVPVASKLLPLLPTPAPSIILDSISPAAADGVSLGANSVTWNDLYLASGGVIHWHNGNVSLVLSSHDPGDFNG